MRSREVVAALATLFAVAAIGREPDVGGFKAYDTPAFTLITHDEVTARRVPPLIAQIEGVVAHIVPGDARASRLPTFFLVVPPRLFVDYVRPCNFVCGAFVPGRFVNYVLITGTRDGYWLRRMVFHQYAHLVVRTRLRGITPLWFDEGLAMLAERTAFQGARSIVGQAPPAFPGWLTLAELLRLDRTSPDRRFFSGCSTSSGNMQTSSWALAHRGIVGEAAFGKQILAYLDAINDLKPIDEAVQSSFGMSVTELNSEMRHYAQRYPTKTIWTEGKLPPPETRTPGRKMERLESLELLADVMFVSGLKPQRLAEVVAAARRIAPDSPGVHVLRMRRAALIRNDEALDILLRQIEPRLSDPKVARGVGLAIFERLNDQRPDDAMSAEKRNAFQQRAFDLLDLSLRSRREDPEAAWAFGMLAAATKQQPGLAIQRLLSASESAPKHADLAMATALVYESWQQQDQMISHLADTARFASSAEQRTWARTRLEEVKKSITQ